MVKKPQFENDGDLGDCKHGFTAAFCQACEIERLQEQVASLVRQAVAAEREACAKVADTFDVEWFDWRQRQLVRKVAAAIRGRGEDAQ